MTITPAKCKCANKVRRVCIEYEHLMEPIRYQWRLKSNLSPDLYILIGAETKRQLERHLANPITTLEGMHVEFSPDPNKFEVKVKE